MKIGQRCMLSDKGLTMLARRRHHNLNRIGTIVGLKGDYYIVHWDGNAKQTKHPYARQYIKIIQEEETAALGKAAAGPPPHRHGARQSR